MTPPAGPGCRRGSPLTARPISVIPERRAISTASVDGTDGVATQATPALPAVAGTSADSAVFLVDTSLSSNPDRFNIWLKLLRTTLDANRDSLKKFNVLFFSVDAHAYKPTLIDNTKANVDELAKELSARRA